MALHNISPKAYNYVRKKFGNNLPHSETIRDWYRRSDLDASPGISKKSLEALEKLSKNMKEKGNQLTVSLVFDEMSIMRNMTWCRATNKFIGLIDQGRLDANEEFTLANNVLVFMVCGINAHFQQPLAFYFVQTLKGDEKVALVNEIIRALAERGIKVANVTFDGFSANISMCKLLGANLDDKNGNYKPYFPNPYDGSRVYIIFDPSHVMKLFRNILGKFI